MSCSHSPSPTDAPLKLKGWLKQVVGVRFYCALLDRTVHIRVPCWGIGVVARGVVNSGLACFHEYTKFLHDVLFHKTKKTTGSILQNWCLNLDSCDCKLSYYEQLSYLHPVVAGWERERQLQVFVMNKHAVVLIFLLVAPFSMEENPNSYWLLPFLTDCDFKSCDS